MFYYKYFGFKKKIPILVLLFKYMNKTIRFYREEPEGRWYADIPEWTGSKSELEMVMGADNMLEFICEGDSDVKLHLSTDNREGDDSKLEFIREATEYENGAFYRLRSYGGVELNVEMWLCDVTKFVFGEFPKQIFLTKV